MLAPCDFCVCMFAMDEDQNSYLESGMNIEHIVKDTNVCNECKVASEHLFRYSTVNNFNDTAVITTVTDSATGPSWSSHNSETLEGADSGLITHLTHWYFHPPEEGMIACDNSKCPHWMASHFLSPINEGKAYPDCWVLPRFLRKNRGCQHTTNCYYNCIV